MGPWGILPTHLHTFGRVWDKAGVLEFSLSNGFDVEGSLVVEPFVGPRATVQILTHRMFFDSQVEAPRPSRHRVRALRDFPQLVTTRWRCSCVLCRGTLLFSLIFDAGGGEYHLDPFFMPKVVGGDGWHWCE